MNREGANMEEASIHHIFPLNEEKTFSEDEAFELIPLLHLITSKAKNKISSLNGQVEYHRHHQQQAQTFQLRMNQEIQKWSEKVRRLGGIPLSLYKVKIPASEGGNYTWEFPSSDLTYNP